MVTLSEKIEIIAKYSVYFFGLAVAWLIKFLAGALIIYWLCAMLNVHFPPFF
jgi:hypothetical protein